MKWTLELEIDPYDEHIALELEQSVNDHNKPIMYWDAERNVLRELKPIKAELKESK